MLLHTTNESIIYPLHSSLLELNRGTGAPLGFKLMGSMAFEKSKSFSFSVLRENAPFLISFPKELMGLITLL